MPQFMVIETFFDGCKGKVYERFNAKGRMVPEGLVYLDSWLEKDGNRCFQLMETEEFSLFQLWTQNWNDLVKFEIIELGNKPENKEAGK